MFDLTQARLDRGETILEAAAAMGVDRRILGRAEQGKRVHPRNALLIADYYGVRPSDIWSYGDSE